MNQLATLLDRLRVGPVTPLEALNELGIYRLGGRVYDLRQSGYKIETEIIRTTTGKHVARYWLVEQMGAGL